MTACFFSRHLGALAVAGASLLATVPSHAASFSLSGQAAFHNDVVMINFSVNAPGAVRLWTDSWMSGTNFDPYLSLFSASGALIGINDDAADDFGPGPGFFDAGLLLAAQPGSYRLTLTAAPNAPTGPQLLNGFAFDAETPIAIGNWDQPGYDINANDQKGTFWQLQLQGVDLAAVVPEPTSLALMFSGLLALLHLARRNKR